MAGQQGLQCLARVRLAAPSGGRFLRGGHGASGGAAGTVEGGGEVIRVLPSGNLLHGIVLSRQVISKGA